MAISYSPFLLILLISLLGLGHALSTPPPPTQHNSTYLNPILPGFHPDPSCIFVPEWDDTFFCATSSFNAFPGIPIHASKDLVNWKLIGHALNRPEQLPSLAQGNGSTSGIWAPTLRYHEGAFWVVTTMVHNMLPADDPKRWDNFIFKAKNPYQPKSWSKAVHFDFQGYDTSPYWDTDGKVYMLGAHPWRLSPELQMATIDLETGKLHSQFKSVWNGTGGHAPEGPHIYRKDGWYYILAAEGGTGVTHMVTIARSKNIWGPYESDPWNPIVTNANTTSYFQTVGHADLFQDSTGNWWGVALSTRSGPEHETYPMGRETVLAPVTWDKGAWPIWTNISGTMNAWPLPPTNRNIRGSGPFITDPDSIDFTPGSSLPAHFTYWRFPDPAAFTISPPGHPNTLRLTPSALNLTGLDGLFASTPQTFVGRRQTDTLFTYSVDMSYTPRTPHEEAGVTVFLTQDHHIRMGVSMLPSSKNPSNIIPHFTFYAISAVPVTDAVFPVPDAWRGKRLRMEIKAFNVTHYAFSAGPADARSQMVTVGVAPASVVSCCFTGSFVGVYATSNGGGGMEPAYFSKWRYVGQGQYLD